MTMSSSQTTTILRTGQNRHDGENEKGDLQHHETQRRQHVESGIDDDDDSDSDNEIPFELLDPTAKQQQRNSLCCLFRLSHCWCIPQKTVPKKIAKRNSFDTSGTSVVVVDEEDESENNNLLHSKMKKKTNNQKKITDPVGDTSILSPSSSSSSVLDENMFLDARDGQHEYEYDALRLNFYCNSRSASSSPPPGMMMVVVDNQKNGTAAILEFLKGLFSVMVLNQFLVSLLPNKQNHRRNVPIRQKGEDDDEEEYDQKQQQQKESPK